MEKDMDTQKKDNLLLLLKNKRNTLVIEQKSSQKRPWTSKQIGIYIFGLYGITIICALAPINILIIPAIYALGTPIIIINKNKKKTKELELEINNLNSRIKEMEDVFNKAFDHDENTNESTSVIMGNTIELLEETSKQNDGPKLVKTNFTKKY